MHILIRRHDGKKIPGFTLVEILVIVAVLAVFLNVATLLFRKMQLKSDLLHTSDLVQQALSRSRSLALAGVQGSSWGFSVEQGVLFKGESFTTRDPAFDEMYAIPRDVRASGLPEVSFRFLEGVPSTTGSIVLMTGTRNIVTIALQVTSDGLVTNVADRITFCHRLGDESGITMETTDALLPQYLAQGDTLGPCTETAAASSSGTLVAAGSSSSNTSVVSGGSSSASSSATSVAAESASSSISDATGSSSSTPPLVAGLLLLQPAAAGSLSLSGNAQITVAGSVIVNASHTAAVQVTGNARIVSGNIRITGTPGYSVTGNAHIDGPVTAGVAPIGDPLASLLDPAPPATEYGAVHATSSRTLQPGLYTDDIAISGNATVTLTPGLYYVRGNLSVSGNGGLVGTDITVYMEAGGVNLSGNGVISLGPPASGTYQSITFFQRRSNAHVFRVTGNGATTILGTIYAPASVLTLSGNGSQNVIGSFDIVNTATVSGNGSLQIQ